MEATSGSDLLQERYQLLEPLGPHGTTFRGLDTRGGRAVALRRLRPPDGAPPTAEGVTRLRRLIERMGKMSLTGVAMPLDVVVIEDVVWLVSDLVGGEALQEYVGKAQAGQVVAWALELLGVVEKLHDISPAHLVRTLKPAHCIVSDR